MVSTGAGAFQDKRACARRLHRYVVSGAALAVAAAFVFRALDRFAGAGHDDTFITLLAAEQLAAGEGFVNFNGDPAEIGSSWLHVVLLAGVRAAGVQDLYLANKTLGLCFGLVASLLVLAAHRRFFPRTGVRGVAHGLLAAAVGASLPTYLFWSLGGLETPLVALLLVGLTAELAARSSRHAFFVGALGSCLALARPEGFVYLAAIVAVGVARRARVRWWLAALGPPVVVISGAALIRTLVFGTSVPLPVLAKAESSNPFARVEEGVGYLSAFAEASALGGLLLAAFAARVVLLLFQVVPLRARLSVYGGTLASVALVAVAGVHLLAVLLAGGDWMAFYRFVAPVVPLLGVAASQSLAKAAELIPPKVRRVTLPVALMALALAAWPLGRDERSGLYYPYIRNTCLQRSLADLVDERLGASLGQRVRQLNHPYFRDITQLDPFLRGPLRQLSETRGHLVVATQQMGFLPYRLRELGFERVHLIDSYGITDPELARLPGERVALGLRDGAQALRFLDPASGTALAHAVVKREPQLAYVLRVDRASVDRLAELGWVLIWNAPEAKIFARREVAARLRWRPGEDRAPRGPG